MAMIERGTRCTSKQEFEALIRRWYDSTDERTLGDFRGEKAQGVTPWVFVAVGAHEVKAHADTTRDAVRRYLELVSIHGPGLTWQVRHSRAGNVNKVCIEPDGSPTKGLFLYTTKRHDEPLDL